MDAANNYWLIWLVYLGASAVFYPIFWHLTRFARWRWLSYSLRAIMAALILTPWSANTAGTTLAPALMIATLDAITIGSDAAIRAAVPLLLALVAAEIAATVLWFARGRKSRS